MQRVAVRVSCNVRVRGWFGRIGVKTLYIEPGSPWENGYCESLNSKLRDELLNGEIFTTLREAQVLIENGENLTELQMFKAVSRR